MGMIPNTRPVTGRDLDYLRFSLGLSAGDAAWLFGLSMTKWMVLVNQNSDVPVGNPTLALLARMLDAHVEANPLPKPPKPSEVFEMIKPLRGAEREIKPWEMKHIKRRKAYPLDKQTMAILFGSEGSSGYRWLTRESRYSPTLGRLFVVFVKLFEAESTHRGRNSIVSELENFVEIEANTRGIADIWRTGHWSKTRKRRTRGPSQGAKASKVAEKGSAGAKRPRKAASQRKSK